MNKEYESKMQKLLFEKDISNAIDQLVEISNTMKIPRKLYRYRPMTIYTIDEIVNQHVFLTDPNSDDIFDSSVIVSDDNNIIQTKKYTDIYNNLPLEEQDKFPQMRESGKIYTEDFEALESLNKKIPKNVRIACFTQNNTNVPMWWYYAGKHQGICVEYHIDLDKIAELAPNNFFLEVIYTRKPDKYLNVELNYNKWFKLMAVMCSVLKAKDWEFEKEWRIIALQDKPSYVDLKMEAIYFGVNATEESKKLIYDCISQHGLDIKLYQMEKSLTGLKHYRI